MASNTAETSMFTRVVRWLVLPHSGAATGRHRARPERPWSIAAHMWRILQQQRMILPRLRFYVVVGAIGAAIGAARSMIRMRVARGHAVPSTVHGALGMRWLLPTIALPLAAWCVTLSSIWWRGGRVARTRELRADLVAVVDPNRGRALRQRNLRSRILSSGLPLFEVVDWPGAVTLQGWAGSPARIENVTLAFAARRRDRPVLKLVVSAARESRDDEVDVRGRCVDEAAHLFSAADEKRTFPETVEARLAMYRRSTDAARAIPWFPTAVNIDDRIVEGYALETDGATLSYYAVPGAWLTVTAAAGELPILRSVADREGFVTSLID